MNRVLPSFVRKTLSKISKFEGPDEPVSLRLAERTGMANFFRFSAVVANSFFVLCTVSVSVSASELTHAPATQPGSWLQGIPTNFVAEVYFDDVGFERYLPVQNPYATVEQALKALPSGKVNGAIADYDLGSHRTVSPFWSRNATSGRPHSTLFQNADFRFKTSCAMCPERLSFSHGSVGFAFRPEAGQRYGTWILLKLEEIGASHFSRYPFLREVLEVQALMLDPHNPKSYVVRRATALHQGAQAVLNFAQSTSVELSDFTKQQLAELAKSSVKTKLEAQIERDVNHEAATSKSSMGIGSNFDPYPYQSISGKHVLLRAILDSTFETGEAQSKGAAVVANYRARLARAAYFSAEFRNERQDIRRDIGPRPALVKPYAWWTERARWFSAAPVRAAVVTCEALFTAAL